MATSSRGRDEDPGPSPCPCTERSVSAGPSTTATRTSSMRRGARGRIDSLLQRNGIEACPQIPTRHGPVGAPRLAQAPESGRRGGGPETIRPLYRFDNAQIVDWQHIRSEERRV